MKQINYQVFLKFSIWLITSLLMAVLIGVNSYLLLFLYVGGLAGLVLLIQPTFLMWVLVLNCLIVNGTLQSAFSFNQAQWVSSILGFMLLISSFIKFGIDYKKQNSKRQYLNITFFITSFILIIIFSTVLNFAPVPQVIVGLRTYIPFLGVFFALSSGLISEEQIKKIFKFMWLVVFMQIPAIIYQVLVVVPKRASLMRLNDTSTWDSINGTFGGDMLGGGGASGSLALYIAVIALILTACWRNGLIKNQFFYFFIFTSLIVAGSIEAKVIFVLIPIGFFFLNKELIIKRPTSFVFGLLGMLTLLSLILYAYFEVYYKDTVTGDPMTALQTRFLYSFDPDFRPSDHWLGRVSGILVWLNNHDILNNPATLLFGHGAAAATTFSSFMGPSREVLQYGPGLEVSGFTKLLWEGGVLGTLMFFLIMFSCMLISKRCYSNENIDIWHRSTCKGIYASMPILAIALFYEVTSVSSPPVQFLAMFLFGYIAWLNKYYACKKVLA